MNKLFLKKMNEKDVSILKNVSASFLIKGGALLVSFATLPAFINFFEDQQVLGVWFTVFSILSWILTFDFGIGNGLRNKLVESIVKNDKNEIREKISSAYFIIGLFTFIAIIVGSIFFNHVNWNKVFNISSSLISNDALIVLMILSFLTVMVQFFLRLITFIIYALQKSAVNNLIALLTSVLQLLCVVLLPSQSIESNLINLSILYFLCVNLPLLAATIYTFRKDLPGCQPKLRYVKKESARDIVSLGGVFFWNQIMFTALTQTNLIIITYFIDPTYIVDYQIYQRIYMMLGMVFSLALAPMWSAITKALAENDNQWINKYFNILSYMTIAIFACQLLIVPFMQTLVNLWLQEKSIIIDYNTSILFAIFGGAFIIQSMLSTFACGIGKMKLQAYFYTIGVVIKIILAYVVMSNFGEWNLVILIDILILLPYCLVQFIILKRQFRLTNDQYVFLNRF